MIEVTPERSQDNHPAPFPRRLAEFFIKAFTDEGDIAFDPFLGSGTTIAAAQVLGRAGFGCEISPAYCDLIVGRIAKLAQLEPYLADTGETWMSVLESRKGVLAGG